jgi:hypothetical protein
MGGVGRESPTCRRHLRCKLRRLLRTCRHLRTCGDVPVGHAHVPALAHVPARAGGTCARLAVLQIATRKDRKPRQGRFGRARVATYPRPVRRAGCARTRGVQPAVVAARLLPYRRRPGPRPPARASTCTSAGTQSRRAHVGPTSLAREPPPLGQRGSLIAAPRAAPQGW